MSVNSFDVNLFNKLCESTDENKNIFFSPMSISNALSMLLKGSDGKTKKQLEEVLGFENEANFHRNLDVVIDIIQSKFKRVNIKLANSIFPSTTFEMVAKYKSNMESSFKSQIQSLDYKKNAEISKKIINDRVARCTNGKITGMFCDLDSDTACVLVSCIYFKGEWYEKFKSYNTRDATFYCTEDKTSTVEMMTKVDYYSYLSVDDKGFKCVKIPYKQPDLCMLIILPDERFGLKSVIEKLDVKTIKNLKEGKKFSLEAILLRMPKFKIEYEANLNETLRSLGIKDAFDEKNADFSAMSKEALQKDRRLHVSEVVHKAFVETNEEKIEAAAATGKEELAYSDGESYDFTVDHPFLFMISYQTQTLFMGKVTSL